METQKAKRQSVESVRPRREPTQARSRARFDRILDVALYQIVATGVDGVKMSDIASEAEISIASLYQYFPDKAAIVATLAERTNGVLQDMVAEIFVAVVSPDHFVDAIEALLESLFDYNTSAPETLALWRALQSDNRLQTLLSDELHALSNTIYMAVDRIRPHWQDTDKQTFCRTLTSMMLSTVRTSMLWPEDEARNMIDMFRRQALSPFVRHRLSSGIE